MTKLLVLSDSHGARDAIKRILNKEQNNVDAVIFLLVELVNLYRST